MAVTSAKLKFNVSGGLDNKGKGTFTSIYLVETDDINDHAVTVIGASSVPDYGASFAVGNDTHTSAVTKKSAELVNQEEARKWWNLTIEYSSADSTADNEDGKKPEKPEDDTPEINWGFTSIQRALDRDFLGLEFNLPSGNFALPYPGGFILNANLDGKATSGIWGAGRERKDRAVTNTAGEPFDPPLQHDMWVQTLRITRSEQVGGMFPFPPDVHAAFQGRINSQAYFNRSPYQCLCAGINAQRLFRGSIEYYRSTYEFHLHNGSEIWFEPVLNTGFTSSGAVDSLSDYANDALRIKIKINGEPANVPQLLDVDGNAIPNDVDMASKAVYVPVYPYPAIDFGFLNLQELL